MFVVDGDLGDIVNALEATRRIGEKTKATTVSPKVKKQWESLHALRHIVEIVPNTKLEPSTHVAFRRQMIDALFRPTSSDWRPYQLQMELFRTQSVALGAVCRSLASGRQGLSILAVHGAAGTGKTTILKRVALDLSNEGLLVLWYRRNSYEPTSQQFRKIASAVREVLSAEKAQKLRLVVFVDDPWGLRVSASEAIAQLEGAHMDVLLILGIRDTDYLVARGGDTALPDRPNAEVAVSHVLDNEELAQLPAGLVRLGAVATEQEGKQLLASNPYRNAADVLCSLWYLLPETRYQFESSLQDEYRRLGDPQRVIETAAASAAQSSEVAHAAYEAVTVASSLNIGLPIEVLVRSLDVDYADWLTMASPNMPVWGLLYDEFDEASESYVYRTRNEVVTRVLLKLVDGGLGGHSGQYRVLKRLLAACSGSSPSYRNFVHDVLIRSRETLEERLSFEQGMELYETATSALSTADRSLEHHRGLWIKNVGKNLSYAYEQLQKALDVPDSPGLIRDEPREYIQTSLAATVLAQVRDGEISREAGFDRVMDHLRRAATTGYYNVNQSHVMARCLLEMAKAGESSLDSVTLSCVGDALAEIERSLQIIGAVGKRSIRFQKALAFFEDLQQRAFEDVADIADLDVVASQWFEENGSQLGFVVVARQRLAQAAKTNTGSHYNEVAEYIGTCIDTIRARKAEVVPELLAVRVDLMVRWRLQRVRGAVDWTQFCTDLESVLGAPKYRDDSLRRFYYAVALYQRGRITEAHATFAGLRRANNVPFPQAIRCYYVGREGHPKRLQGIMQRSYGRAYVSIAELSDDVIAQGSLETGPGGTLHVYVGFAVSGPVAVTQSPGPDDLLIPTA